MMTRRQALVVGGVGAAGTALLATPAAAAPPLPTLAELIAATPDGAPGVPSVVDGAGATFVDESTVRITGRHHLVIRNLRLEANTDGSGVAPWASGGTSINWPRNRSHIRIDGGSSNITIENVTVRGAHPNGGTDENAYVAAFEAQHGFDIDDGSTFVTVRDCTVTDVYGDFVYIRANRVTVEGLIASRNGRQGVAITNASDITLRDMNLSYVRRSMVDIETNTATNQARRIAVEDCVFDRARLLGLACKGQGSNVGDITFRRCSWTKTGAPVISFETPVGQRRGPLTFEDCTATVTGSPRAGFEFARIDGLTFRRVTASAPATRNMRAVTLIDCGTSFVGPNSLTGFGSDVAVYQ